MKYGCTFLGVLGLIFGGVAGYMQMDNEENETRSMSASSEAALTNPKVQSIEVISNE